MGWTNQYRIRRWADITQTSLVSLLVLPLLLYLQDLPRSGWLTFPGTMPLWLQIACFSTLFAVLLALAQRRLALTSDAVRLWFLYPPCWFASLPPLVIGFALLHFKFSILAYGALTLVIAWVMFMVHSKGPRLIKGDTIDDRPERSPRFSLFTEATDFDRDSVQKWLLTEDAIRHESEDCFDAQAIAERVWTKLNESRRVAVLGGFGTGKSSVITLACSLAKARKAWTVTIDGWGLRPSDVSEVILREIVIGLGSYVDVLRLAGIPAKYREAMSALNSTPLSILKEFTIDSPMEVLTRLDSVLGAVDRKLIVFLEDLDRQASDETLTAIAALLDRLKRLEFVNFVIAIDASRRESADVIRLCEHSEALLPPPVGQTHRLLNAVIQICESIGNDIQPNPAKLDEWRVRKQSQGRLSLMERSGPNETAEALVSLCRTPRNLKSVLRQTVAAWDELHGEVDLTELFVEECLRVVAPSVWQLLCDDIGQFRASRELFRSDSPEAKKARQQTRLQLVTQVQQSAEKDRSSVADVERLITALFPGWQNEPTRVGHEGQDASSDSPTDYWYRMVRRSIPEKVRDQVVFRHILDWRETKSTGLPACLFEFEHAGQTLERFQHLIPAGEIHALTNALHNEMLKRDRALANFDRTGSALSLWRLANRHRQRKRGSFIRSQIEQAIRGSLMLAIDIGYYWSSEYTGAGLDVRRLYHFTRLQAKACFVDLEAILTAIPPIGDTSNPFTLSQLVQAGQLKLKHHESTFAKHWAWLINLLGSTNSYPFILLIQVVSLFTMEVELSFRIRERRLNEEFASLLIPDDRTRTRIFRTMRDSWANCTVDEQGMLSSYQMVHDDLQRILADKVP